DLAEHHRDRRGQPQPRLPRRRRGRHRPPARRARVKTALRREHEAV
ncbi:MAG: hypothetical protein AVDCRST_MAG06-2823, partial [uncultured Nocardioides sp.]